MLGVQQQAQPGGPAQARPQRGRAEVHLDLLVQGAAQPPTAGARLRVQAEEEAAHEGVQGMGLLAQVRGVVPQVLQQALPEPGTAAAQHHRGATAWEQLGVGSAVGHTPGVEAQTGQLGQQLIPRARHGGWLTLALLAGLCACSQRPPPAGIILVSFDTLRADRLAAYGGRPEVTPNLGRFAGEAVVFEEAWATAPETLFSHASLLTGQMPSALGPVDYNFILPPGLPTLPELLSLYNYRSAAFVSGGHMDASFGLGRGFGEWTTAAEWGSLWHSGPAALSWLDQHMEQAPEQPFLLLVHGYDCHHRYLKPDPWGHRFVDGAGSPLGEQIARSPHGTQTVVDGRSWSGLPFDRLFDLGALRPRDPAARAALAARAEAEGAASLQEADHQHLSAIYDGAASYADANFGLFMAGLQERGLLQTSTIVVFSDHGEELGEQGLYNHRLHLSEPALRVPLMLRLPGGQGARRVAGIVQLTDVLPTLLELVGGEAPAGIEGRSLLPALRGEPWTPREVAVSEGVFRMTSITGPQGGLTFSGVAAHSPYAAGLMRMAPLDGPAFQPWEGTSPAGAEELRQRLIAWEEAHPAQGGPGQAASAEQLRILREKGYWGPQ
jgi:arylsulfatase A-like enzyme